MIEPKRTATNIRYYDDNDLKYILNVSILNNYGIKISEIAKMPYQKMQEMVLVISEKASPYESQIKALISAMFSLDEAAFNRLLSSNILRIGLEETMIHVVFPFLHQIGVLWMTGSIHPAHEHFITNLIRQKLFVAIDAQTGNAYPANKRFLLFLPEGEPHEIGLLFANYIIRARGHEVIYLGQNQPFSDLKTVFEYYEPHYVLSALTSGLADEDVQEFVNKLSECWPSAQILLTGHMVLNAKDLQVPSNVMILKSLEELRKEIDQLESVSR